MRWTSNCVIQSSRVTQADQPCLALRQISDRLKLQSRRRILVAALGYTAIRQGYTAIRQVLGYMAYFVARSV
jgi:hypothetical protein